MTRATSLSHLSHQLMSSPLSDETIRTVWNEGKNLMSQTGSKIKKTSVGEDNKEHRPKVLRGTHPGAAQSLCKEQDEPYHIPNEAHTLVQLLPSMMAKSEYVYSSLSSAVATLLR